MYAATAPPYYIYRWGSLFISGHFRSWSFPVIFIYLSYSCPSKYPSNVPQDVPQDVTQGVTQGVTQ